MAKSKAKEATVPLKGEKKKKAPKASETARAKPSHLSEEMILESGSESDSGSSRGGSDTESEDEKRQNTKKPDVRKVAATEPSEPAVPDDISSEEEDSEEESDEQETKVIKATSHKSSKAAPTTNGTKRKADESSSGEEESDSELPDAPTAKKARSESSSSEEESNEDTEKGEKMDVDKPAALPPGIVASSIPAQPFEPPSGYVPMDTKAKSAFSHSDLGRKQIWHITAPADVPISSLHEVALDAVQSGKPVMSHGGLDYILSEEKASDGSEIAVLLPGKEGYAPVQQPISRTLHLKQHIVLPNLSDKQADQLTGSNTAGDAATAAVTAVRPQPRGLRMRYRPPGFGVGNPGRIGSGSESEAEESQPVGNEAVFQFPKKPKVSGKEKKDKEKKDKEKKEKKEKKSKKKT